VMAICEGQMAPVTSAAPLETARDQYLYRVACSDAALLEAAARAGGVCGGLPQDQIDTLGRFGHAFGMAARIAADAADYEGAGQALRSGVITLPLIYAAASAPQLVASLDQQPDARRAAEAQAEVRRLGGVQRAREDARGFARHAAELLGGLPVGAARDALAALAAGAA
jgi:geranylgeranyl pyrophosphate synthase